MGERVDIPPEALTFAKIRAHLDSHPEIELRETRQLLYLVLDAVGEPVRIPKDLLLNPPSMYMFMQEDIETSDVLFAVERLDRIVPDED